MKAKATRELVRINSLVSEIDRAYHQAASNFGLADSIMNILYAICNYGDDVQVSELVALTSMPKQTLNSALRKCEKAGLTEIEVTSHKNKKVKLTSEGKALAAGGILGAYDATFGLMGTMFGIDGCRVTACLANSSLAVSDTDEELALIGSVPLDAVVAATAPALGIDLSKYTNTDGTYNYFGAFDCASLDGEAAADKNGNIGVSGEQAAYGEALKSTLGEGWNYEEGKLPVPKAQ